MCIKQSFLSRSVINEEKYKIVIEEEKRKYNKKNKNQMYYNPKIKNKTKKQVKAEQQINGSIKQKTKKKHI